MLRRFTGVLLLLIPILLAACGGGAVAGDFTPGPFNPSAPQGLSNTGREDRTSAADLDPGEGTDFCDRYPDPELVPFKAEGATPLVILPNDHTMGEEGAPLSVIIYGDIQDPNSAGPTLALMDNVLFRGDLTLTFRHIQASPDNNKSVMAALATEAANNQDPGDGFFRMLRILYERQAEWSPLSDSSFFTTLVNYADELGFDPEAFAADLGNDRMQGVVEFNMASSTRLPNLTGVPYVVINDIPLSNPSGSAELVSQVMDVALLRRIYIDPPPMEIDGENDYVAWIVTENGVIAVNLFADLAPETVNNFAYLACSGYYDNITWHRVIPDFVAQTGDPTGTGFGGPNYNVPDEYSASTLEFDRKGWLSMAKGSAPNSAGGQWFITLGPAENLNGSFTIFGQVVGGAEVVDAISPRDPTQTNDPGDPLIRVIVREIER